MTQPLLETRAVGVRFGDFRALTDVSLSVASKSIHAVIGPNGAGKTTFFNVICGLQRPSGGDVRLRGEVISNLPLHRRVGLGMSRSFQITNIFKQLSVFENLRLGAQATQGASGFVFWRSRESLTGVTHKAERLLVEMDLEGLAGTRAGDLSHGDQRALEVGLALAADPEIVLLDEPLAGMGFDDIQRMKQLIQRMRSHRAVLLIEHNMGVVLDISDRVTVLQQGRVLASGTPAAVRSDPAVSAAYLGGEA